jgi:DNA polymerase III sliding clamp (beta) subunit (PCNA family)
MVTIPKTFVMSAINNVCSIIDDNASAPIYSCMRLYTSGINVEVTALDITGKRTFAQAGIATNNNPQQEVLLEATKFKKSLKIFEDYNELEFYMDQNMVRIDGTDAVSQYRQKTQGMISNISYFARRLSGAFPTNIRANFNPMPTEFSELNKAEILNSFTRIKAIEDQTNNGIVGFEITGNNAIITLNSVHGNIEDSITTENSVAHSFKTSFKYESLSDIMKTIDTDTFEIGILPNHPSNYVIKSKGNSDVMFTVPGMVGASATP